LLLGYAAYSQWTGWGLDWLQLAREPLLKRVIEGKIDGRIPGADKSLA